MFAKPILRIGLSRTAVRRIHTIDALEARVNTWKEPVPPAEVLALIDEYHRLQVQVYDYNKFWNNPTNKRINHQITQVLQNPHVTFDKTLLAQLFRMKLPSLTNINIIGVFYERSPTAYIDKAIALVPFRQSLFNGDLQSALKLTDITVGHPNYTAHKHSELKTGVVKLVGSGVGITVFSKYGVQELIDSGILGDAWRYLGSVNTLVVTYLLNSSFLMTIVKFGRQLISSGGDYLTWQKGTFYSHWYKHADEMMFCSKIVEADLRLNGGGVSGGEVSSDLATELCRTGDNDTSLAPGYTRDGHKVRLLDLRDNLEELKLQAYWMSGGDGFEWVEPDQDPAELIWKRHLKKFEELGAGDEGKALKWADQVIEPEQK
ncbi:hypothetical protein PSN45_002196 [Yamadazyma tenuis]|uniref:Uncharacterized protein n=1 Tax=Candida tenuis (strain ATCC 10573 / BCRC 21748 / CBS 615 / JCM 9827 / NBRC 10315 / NRRL Y-1498 / VKM Y-70) TaxID=590646 RepID=G3BFP1_CANTC|nr:uncharacterized protein CANTEDRAFT_116094 [Yamadazyma tenuis ATCC 10573]EGV60066.1 hypothetical protein CANTEDRAFT_116094 [Yamadazyma tenuis ATCC 10573]WEJ94702.1 hypothetical protein PSN45_002196 [Yamadazyma tenuis]